MLVNIYQLQNINSMCEIIPTISIIIPVYNTEKYLRRCLDSIVAQTYKDFECFLLPVYKNTYENVTILLDCNPDFITFLCHQIAEIDYQVVI